jgi:hypothetical protein
MEVIMIKLFPTLKGQDLMSAERICNCGCGDQSIDYKNGFSAGIRVKL